ncbi:MAG: sigma-70 family RNA polymerase sigma factor [Planctomycetota bacterium]
MATEAHEMFEILAREHAPMVFAFLRAAGHQSNVAEDLLQEALIVAWKKIDTFDRKRPFGPWLRGIAGKLSLAEFRKSSTAKEATVEAEVIEHLQCRFDNLDRAEGFSFDEKVKILDQCLGRLSADEQTIVVEKYQNNRQLKQIAKLVSLSVEAAKKKLQRARARIKACMVRQLTGLAESQLKGHQS